MEKLLVDLLTTAAPAALSVFSLLVMIYITRWRGREIAKRQPTRCATDEHVADLESVLLVRNAALEEAGKKIARLEESLSEKEKEMLNVKVDAHMYGMGTYALSAAADPDPEKTAKLLAAGRACAAAGLAVPPDILAHFGGTLPKDGAPVAVQKKVLIWKIKDTILPNGHQYVCDLDVPPGTTSINMVFSTAAKINPSAE